MNSILYHRERTPMTGVCPNCHGEGHTPYRAFNIITRESRDVDVEEFDLLPDDEETADALHVAECKDDVEVCPVCWGAGEVRIACDILSDYLR